MPEPSQACLTVVLTAWAKGWYEHPVSTAHNEQSTRMKILNCIMSLPYYHLTRHLADICEARDKHVNYKNVVSKF